MQIVKKIGTRPAFGCRALSPLLASSAVMAVLTVAPHVAQAQVSHIIPIRLKLGVLLPNDRDTKNLAGNTHLSGEIDVSLPSSGGGQQSLISVGYSRGSRHGGTYTVIPVSLTKISSPGNPAKGLTGNVYYGAGFGLYFVRASGLTQYFPGGENGEGASLRVYSKSRTLFGTSLVAGYQTPFSFFVEAKYHVVIGTIDGYSPNGLSVFIGRHL